MRHPPSLALRVTLLFGIAAAIVFPVFGWIIDRSINHHFSDEDTAELQVITTAARQAFSTIRSEDTPVTLKQQLDSILTRYHGASLFIATQDGYTIFTSSSSGSSAGPDLSELIRDATPALHRSSVQQWRNTGHTYRVLSQRFDHDDGRADLATF